MLRESGRPAGLAASPTLRVPLKRPDAAGVSVPREPQPGSGEILTVLSAGAVHSQGGQAGHAG